MRVVMYSGGACSYNAARRIREKGQEATLLFCDVGEEDESTYDSVATGVDALGFVFHMLHKDTVWGLFHSSGMMGKPGAGHCSRILKRELAQKWVKEHCDPADTRIVIGLSWEEMHRTDGVRRFWAPYEVEFPMQDEPWLTKEQQIRNMEADGVVVPELYRIGGFEHANCGGACVKAGHGQWLRLLQVRRQRYLRWEHEEFNFRERTGKDVSILRDRTGGTVKPLTLERLRETFEANGQQMGMFDSDGGAGCGCFSDLDDQA